MSFNEDDKYIMINCENSETEPNLFLLNLLPYYFDYDENTFHAELCCCIVLTTSVGNTFNIKVVLKGGNRSEVARHLF